jgi:putative ABC transport system permease protein
MWKATVKGILARKVRLLLTALAVLLGVSFVSGTYVLTDTLDRSFQGLFDEFGSGIDLVVRHQAPFGGDSGRQRFSSDVVDDVSAVDGVSAANGVLFDYAQFVDRDGENIQTGGAPTNGITWSQQGHEGPLRLVRDGDRRGHPPDGRHQIAMDASTAREYGFHIGDRVRVLLEGPAETFRIVALFTFGDQRQLGAVTFAAFDLETAQRVFDAPDLVDWISVTAEPGVSERELRSRIRAAIGPTYDVQTGQTFAADRGDEVLDFLDLLTQLLLGFAAIGLVVGAFIIFNTFTILVAQRTQELGLLRAMGASDRQVIASVIVEATVVGAIAAVAGVVVGLGLAAGLLALVSALGRDIPDGNLVLEQRTILASLAVGVGVTVAASVWPAVRAARVPPIAAITDVLPERVRPMRRRVLVGALLVTGGIVALTVGLGRASEATADVLNDLVDLLVLEIPIIGLIALGALLVFFGAVILLAALARPLAALLGLPLRAMDVTGVLARGNAMRNPRRTAATASALVIGLALVGLVSIFGASAKASVRTAIDAGIRADFILKAQQFAGFSPQVAERLDPLPALSAVAPFRFGNVRVNLIEEVVTGVPARALGHVVDLSVQKGSTAAMARDGVLLHTDAAKEYQVGVGDAVTIQFPLGFQSLRVAGIYDQADFLGLFPIDFIVAKRAYDQGFGVDEQDALIYAEASGSRQAARSAIEAALGRDFPNIEVLSRREYRADQERQIDRFLAVTIALLLLSEIIAVLGIVNTLALSVYERTRELGLLRAVGMSRRQVRRMVRGESLLIAVIGGLVGAVIGVLWGWVFTTSLETQGISELRIPGVEFAAFIILSMVAGVVAALAPAWRASRLDVLRAVTAE